MTPFLNRTKKNFQHLRKWAKRENHSAFRIYDRDIPEFPLAVDWYDGAVVVSIFERARASRSGRVDTPMRDDDDEDEGIDYMDDEPAIGESKASANDESNMNSASFLAAHELSGGLGRLLGIPEDEVYFKVRRRQSGLSQYNRFAQTGRTRIVKEYGIPFVVNLSDYLDTGLFLDHRPTRRLVGELSQRKRCLNLFAYTCTASVHAALAGAQEVTSVDLSKPYLAWGQENFKLNALAPERYNFLHADVLRYLSEAGAAKAAFDVIFLDPPSFSNSKRMEGHFDVQEHHTLLIQLCRRILAPGGALIFSTNMRRFKMRVDETQWNAVEDITQRTLPPDYRNERVHKCWLLR